MFFSLIIWEFTEFSVQTAFYLILVLELISKSIFLNFSLTTYAFTAFAQINKTLWLEFLFIYLPYFQLISWLSGFLNLNPKPTKAKLITIIGATPLLWAERQWEMDVRADSLCRRADFLYPGFLWFSFSNLCAPRPSLPSPQVSKMCLYQLCP